MQVIHDPVFNNFETGTVPEDALRVRITEILGFDELISKEVFEDAWNALILDIPIARLQLLEKLSHDHRLFLLSNTNSIHIRRVTGVVQELIGEDSIGHLFEEVYYSHVINMRKPGREIYDFVLQDSNLNPKETVFLDDSPLNFTGAHEAGIDTIFVDRDIREIFA